MILSVSRRTDIPAFYSTWFINRVRAGFVFVRNPMNYHQVSKVRISPDVVDCIVFWTKNALSITQYLDEISENYQFYFQYTLNSYDKELEMGIGALERRIENFMFLAEKYGSKRIIWRYDPIVLNEKYTVDWHISKFSALANRLKGAVSDCVISFVDLYSKVPKNLKGLNVQDFSENDIKKIAIAFSAISRENNFRISTCAEKVELQEYGITHSCCVSSRLITDLVGRKLSAKKDANQREECGCVESIDIGQYNTCRHGCKYCYANFNQKSVDTFFKRHDPNSPFLVGNSEPEDKVTERKVKSLKLF